MIRKLRKVPSGWFGLLTVLVGISAGMGMVRKTSGGTWLCQDGGCVSVQGYTIITLSVISGCWLVYEEIRRLLRLRHIRKLKLRKMNSGDS